MPSSDTNRSESGAPGDAQGRSQQSGGIVERVKDRATAQLSSQKEKATDGLGSVAQFVRQGTQQLRDQHHETIAGYVERAADQIDRFSQQLKGKDVDELFDDAQRLARRHPALFVGSAFVLGVAGARFFKSSSRESDGERWSSEHRQLPVGTDPDVYGSAVMPEAAAGANPVERSGLGARPSSSAQPSQSTGSTRSAAGGRSRRTAGTERS